MLNPCTALSNAPAPEPAYNNSTNRTTKIAQKVSKKFPKLRSHGSRSRVTANLIGSIERAKEGSRGYHGGGVVQDGGDGPVPLSLRRRTEERVRINTMNDEGRGEEGSGREETHSGGVEEGEASRAAGRAEAGVDGGVAVEVRAAAELLLVHLPRPHAGGEGCAAAAAAAARENPGGCRVASITRAWLRAEEGGLCTPPFLFFGFPGLAPVHGLGRWGSWAAGP